MTSFKYIGSQTSEGGSQAGVNNRIIIGWITKCKCKEVSGVMCDRKKPVELKVFKTIIRPAMTHGSQCWAVKTSNDTRFSMLGRKEERREQTKCSRN